MKMIMRTIVSIRVRRLVWSTLVVCLTIFSGAAQTESDSTEVEKPDLSLSFRYLKANNKTKILEATTKAKIDGAWQILPGIKLSFYRDAEEEANLLGKMVTDDRGLASFILPAGTISGSEYTFVAVTEGNDQFDPVSEEVVVAESGFEMSLTEEDSVRQVHISFTTLDAAGNEVPVAEAEIQLYIKRMFGLLPLSDAPETTDENGEVTVDFSTIIGGDPEGNLILVAKVDEHERYGNLEFQRKVKWGTPLVIDPNLSARELWSSRSNAPIYLIVIVNTMLIGIWGVIFYIVYQAFKISRISKATPGSSKLEKQH